MTDRPDDPDRPELPQRWQAHGKQPPEPAPASPPPAPAPHPHRSRWRSATAVLLVMNVVVWVFILGTGGAYSEWVQRLGLRPQGACVVMRTGPGDSGCVWFPGVADGAGWQLLSTAFTHVHPMHLGLNMLGLVILGPVIERVLGTPRFLVVYLLSALAGSVAVYLLAPPWALTVGASGAIFGLLGSLLIVSWWVGADVRGGLVLLAINVAYTFLGANISWQGHLGGLVGGVIVTVLLLSRTPRRRRGRNAAGRPRDRGGQ